DTFDYLKPLFSHWEKNGLVDLSEDYLSLTIAGSFWAVSLAQSVIQVLNTEYQTLHPAPTASGLGAHPHASLKHA
ncbi:heme anaerobic degradation radical SAM methyltransferase ChuW/HutW, partial [Vibrio sp. 10N.261.48.A2]